MRVLPTGVTLIIAAGVIVFGVRYGTFVASDTGPYGYVSEAEFLARGTLQIDQRFAEAQTLAERLAVQQSQFESLRVRVRAELARERAAGPSPAWLGEAPIADEEVELELMRRRRGDRGEP